MIHGKFIHSDRAVVPAIVAWEQNARDSYFILDTGFTGDLIVTPEMAKELGLEITTMTSAHIAAGMTVDLPTATAIGIMEGRKLYVSVFISKGLPLLGMSFLEKFNYKAIVDCRCKTVSLEVSK